MLNKLEFNNLVITNKKIIQKARAQAIAKLVQKLRKLKEALDKQPENQKHKDRLRKNVECMAQLKSLKHKEIIRLLLLQDNKKNNAVMTNGRATPDELAVAILGLNKLMQGLVATFQQTLKLTDTADAAWRHEILETSKRRLKLERTEDKKRKRKELKEQKAQSRKRFEWLEQNKVEEDSLSKSEIDSISNAAGVCQVEVMETTETVEKVTDKKVTKKNNIAPKTEHTLTAKHKKPKHEDAKQKAPERTKKPETERRQLKHNQKHNKVEKEKKERPTFVEDPFFITESGQPYLSTAVVMSDDSQQESDDDDNNYHKERRPPKPMDKRQEHNGSRSNDRHPSWLAKEKIKPIITNFKGKKIKFGDDGSAAETIAATLIAPVLTDESGAGMHPSWIAKQKLKPKIATFTGTKIKFDDN